MFKKANKTWNERESRTLQKSKVVYALVREGFKLNKLLQISQLSRATYYYQVKKFKKEDCNKDIKEKIKEIFIENNGNYGYRRITFELRNRGIIVNHKKVRKIMKMLGLKTRNSKGARCNYSSYRGDVGIRVDNLINQRFEADSPFEKCYTDITEFSLPGIKEKLYLSAILDGYNGEIISFTLSYCPDLNQIKEMLEQAFSKDEYPNLILHSDQGWQYQHEVYHNFLKSKKIKPSMSRKGNSMDNGMMESFFSIIKMEMFYRFEDSFKSLEKLEKAIVEYIDYYNNKRIKIKLNGLSPVQYRIKFSK